MAKTLAELRRQKELNMKARDNYSQIVEQTVESVLKSDSFRLTLANHTTGADSVNRDMVERIVRETAIKTVEIVTDPVNDFLDIAKAKGMDRDKIRRVVESVYDLFCKNDTDVNLTYEDKLEAVAIVMKEKPYYWEDLSVFE